MFLHCEVKKDLWHHRQVRGRKVHRFLWTLKKNIIMPVNNQLNVRTRQTHFPSPLSLSIYIFFPLCTYVSLPPIYPLYALWCQFSVLAFTRQMLVCPTLSLIPHTHTHARAHMAKCYSVSRPVKSSVGVQGPLDLEGHTHPLEVETCRDAQWEGENNNMQTPKQWEHN